MSGPSQAELLDCLASIVNGDPLIMARKLLVEGEAARDEVTAAEVLDFIDTFAGQENTAEEVRDFVQRAARAVREGETHEALAEDPIMCSFVEWCREGER